MEDLLKDALAIIIIKIFNVITTVFLQDAISIITGVFYFVEILQ